MKTANKEQPTTKPNPNGADALVGIAKIVLDYRGTKKPNFAELGRIVGRASSLLKITDPEARSEIENKATLLLAKDLGLVS